MEGPMNTQGLPMPQHGTDDSARLIEGTLRSAIFDIERVQWARPQWDLLTCALAVLAARTEAIDQSLPNAGKGY